MERAEKLLPQELLTTFENINIQAPMVRYSKLPFRQLVSKYNTHITTTPMMLAKEFSRSAFARASEFTTNDQERGTFWMYDRDTLSRLEAPDIMSEMDTSWEPRWNGIGVEGEDEEGEELRRLDEEEEAGKRKLGMRKVRGSLFAQFAANDGTQLADAVELVKPWVDGIDINCGCPQKWAYHEGIGSALLRQPDLVRDLIRTTKQRVGWEFPVSVKIRVDSDLKQTHKLITTAIAAGADILTIHGRTRQQSSTSHPVDLSAIAFGVGCARGFDSKVPTVANGDVWSLVEAKETRRITKCQGVMSARGLLANPALFSPSSTTYTPPSALSTFMDLSVSHSLLFPLLHHHVSYMLEGNYLTSKAKRTWFNSLASTAGVVDFLEDELGVIDGGGRGGLEEEGRKRRREEREEGEKVRLLMTGRKERESE